MATRELKKTARRVSRTLRTLRDGEEGDDEGRVRNLTLSLQSVVCYMAVDWSFVLSTIQLLF